MLSLNGHSESENIMTRAIMHEKNILLLKDLERNTIMIKEALRHQRNRPLSKELEVDKTRSYSERIRFILDVPGRLNSITFKNFTDNDIYRIEFEIGGQRVEWLKKDILDFQRRRLNVATNVLPLELIHRGVPGSLEHHDFYIVVEFTKLVKDFENYPILEAHYTRSDFPKFKKDMKKVYDFCKQEISKKEADRIIKEYEIYYSYISESSYPGFYISGFFIIGEFDSVRLQGKTYTPKDCKKEIINNVVYFSKDIPVNYCMIDYDIPRGFPNLYFLCPTSVRFLSGMGGSSTFS